MSPGERYLADVRRLPCEICVRLSGLLAEAWNCVVSQAHHPRTGVGAGRKASDMDAIALCYEHHQGNDGIHGLGRKLFERRYGVTERELTESTRVRVAALRGERVAGW